MANPSPVRARFEFAWETALRPSTLEALCAPDDYLPGRATLMIRDAADKARFGRELPLTAEARAALDRVCPKSGLIFGKHDCRPFLQAAAKASGLPEEKAKRFSPYDLRHGRLTFLAENSTNLPGIAYLAGHKQLTTTNHYLKSSRRAAETVLAAVSAAQKSEFGIHTGYTDELPEPRSHVSTGANGETRTLTGVTPQEPERGNGNQLSRSSEGCSVTKRQGTSEDGTIRDTVSRKAAVLEALIGAADEWRRTGDAELLRRALCRITASLRMPKING